MFRGYRLISCTFVRHGHNITAPKTRGWESGALWSPAHHEEPARTRAGSKLSKTRGGLVPGEWRCSPHSATFYMTLGKLLSLSVPVFLPTFHVSDALSVIFWGQALSLLLMHESFIKISALGHLDWMSRTQIWAVLKEKKASKIVPVYKFTATVWNKPTGLSDSPLCHELM